MQVITMAEQFSNAVIIALFGMPHAGRGRGRRGILGQPAGSLVIRPREGPSETKLDGECVLVGCVFKICGVRDGVLLEEQVVLTCRDEEISPLVGGDFSPFKPPDGLHELVDLGLAGEREPGPAQRFRIFYRDHEMLLSAVDSNR